MSAFPAVAAALALGAAALVWWSIRPGSGSNRRRADRRTANLALYRTRLDELTEEHRAGRLDADDLAALEEELGAALLADLPDEPEEPRARSGVTALAWLLAAAVPLAAAGLYLEVGAADEVRLAAAAAVLREANVADTDPRLATLGELLDERIAERPEDAEAWYLRAHLRMRRGDYGGSVAAFERLSDLTGPSIEIDASLAQALYLEAGGRATPRMREAAGRVLAAAPNHGLVRELLALDAFARQDYAAAVRHLERALAGGVPAERAATLRHGLEQARTLLADSGSAIELTVSLAEGTSAPAGATLFVFARPPDARRPTAVVRRPAAGFPMTVRLDESDLMLEGETLIGRPLEVVARLSRSGQAAPGAGDTEAVAGTVTLAEGAVEHLRVALAPEGGAAAGEVPAAAAGGLEVSIRLDAGLRAEPGKRVYVLARAVGGPPMPLAVTTLTVGDLPATVRLTDADAMLPGRRLSDAGAVEVVARVSMSGNAIAASGDLEGSVAPVQPGAAETVRVTIDRVL